MYRKIFRILKTEKNKELSKFFKTRYNAVRKRIKAVTHKGPLLYEQGK